MPSGAEVKSEVKSEEENLPKGLKGVDFTLAFKWEESRLLRDLLRDRAELIQWVDDDHKNVISLEALGINTECMSILAAVWCSSNDKLKSPPVKFLKGQAGSRVAI